MESKAALGMLYQCNLPSISLTTEDYRSGASRVQSSPAMASDTEGTVVYSEGCSNVIDQDLNGYRRSVDNGTTLQKSIRSIRPQDEHSLSGFIDKTNIDVLFHGDEDAYKSLCDEVIEVLRLLRDGIDWQKQARRGRVSNLMTQSHVRFLLNYVCDKLNDRGQCSFEVYQAHGLHLYGFTKAKGRQTSPEVK